MKFYNPADWYWTVGGDTTRVFSSKSGDYVPSTDAAYAAFLSDGTAATRIDTEANLGEVLAASLQRPTNAGILDGYLGSQANGVLVQVPFKLIFDLRNDVNVLQGVPKFTVAQARNYVKSKL